MTVETRERETMNNLDRELEILRGMESRILMRLDNAEGERRQSLNRMLGLIRDKINTGLGED
jgi:hypothetical protein